MDEINIQNEPNYPVRFAGASAALFLLVTMALPIWSVTHIGYCGGLTDEGSFWSLLETLWSNFRAFGVHDPQTLLTLHVHNLILAPLVLLTAVGVWYGAYRFAHLWIHSSCDRLG